MDISKYYDGIADALVAGTREFIDKKFARLEQRIAELEARPILKYVGVWDAHRQYNPGEFVTNAGALWHCNTSTRNRPGDGSSDWVLAVKSGVKP